MKIIVMGVLMLFALVGCMQDKKSAKMGGYNPKAAHYNVQLGLAYLRRGNVQRAKRKLLTAMKQDPKSPVATDAMAYFLETTGNKTMAEEYYKRAISYAPDTGGPLNNYGTFLCRHGHYKKADQMFMDAIKDRSYVKTAEVYENAGLCALHIPNIAAAQKYFHRALQEDPQRRTALIESAKLAFQNKQYEKSHDYLANFNQLSQPTIASVQLSLDLAKQQGKKNQVASYALFLKQLKTAGKS